MRQHSTKQDLAQAPIYCSSGDWILVPGDVGIVVAIYSSGAMAQAVAGQVSHVTPR